MRLNSLQIQTILDGVNNFCGKGSRIWLFGSRVDDAKKGGDIDLYIEIEPHVSMIRAKLNLMRFFESNLGEQKIDILMRYKDQTMTPMHGLARSTGQELKHKS